jgi:hypothetical protein
VLGAISILVVLRFVAGLVALSNLEADIQASLPPGSTEQQVRYWCATHERPFEERLFGPPRISFRSTAPLREVTQPDPRLVVCDLPAGSWTARVTFRFSAQRRLIDFSTDWTPWKDR